MAGESEYIFPRFCADFERGEPKPLYHETDTVALTDSPTPRFDLLKLDRYLNRHLVAEEKRRQAPAGKKVVVQPSMDLTRPVRVPVAASSNRERAA